MIPKPRHSIQQMSFQFENIQKNKVQNPFEGLPKKKTKLNSLNLCRLHSRLSTGADIVYGGVKPS